MRCTQSDSVIAFYTNEVHYMLGEPTHAIVVRKLLFVPSVKGSACTLDDLEIGNF